MCGIGVSLRPATVTILEESTDHGNHSLEDINNSCLTYFRKHWECLENNNQQLWQCRRFEGKLNNCVFEKLVSWCSSAIAFER